MSTNKIENIVEEINDQLSKHDVAACFCLNCESFRWDTECLICGVCARFFCENCERGPCKTGYDFGCCEHELYINLCRSCENKYADHIEDRQPHEICEMYMSAAQYSFYLTEWNPARQS